MHNSFLNSKYPIIAAPMNKVSNLQLAIACHESGIFPSISLYNYTGMDFNPDLMTMNGVIKAFQDSTGTSDFILSMYVDHAAKRNVQDLIVKSGVKFLEIIPSTDLDQDVLYNAFCKDIEKYQGTDIKLIVKTLRKLEQNPGIDAVIFKGPDGAGRGVSILDMDYEIPEQISMLPDVGVIASGGISDTNDIQRYLDMGCMAVAIGTLLAASEESPISLATKNKMIASTFSNVERVGEARQNALVFKHINNDDSNNTRSLVKGIQSPNSGIVFAGKAIDKITAVRPVKDIVSELVNGLKI
jgi:NAD(P)H-dependent flavin oxidoreductase YrpB (nitropropane dioxygenase family)